jgi:hypothetical protein
VCLNPQAKARGTHIPAKKLLLKNKLLIQLKIAGKEFKTSVDF